MKKKVKLRASLCI